MQSSFYCLDIFARLMYNKQVYFCWDVGSIPFSLHTGRFAAAVQQ